MNEKNLAHVYTYWDDDRRTFVATFDKWETEPDGVETIELPENFDMYQAENGNWYAYDVTTEPRGESERQDAWWVKRMRNTYALVDAHGEDGRVLSCKTVTGTVDKSLVRNGDTTEPLPER